MNPKTLLLFGDVEKRTSLLYLYDKGGHFDVYRSKNLHKQMDTSYVLVKNMTIDDKDYLVKTKDFSSLLYNYNLKELSEWIHFSSFDVFIVVFSVVKPHTLIAVKEIWIPYLKHHNPSTPIILVGNDTDLRSNSETLARLSKRNMRPITTEEGYELARKINAAKYLECSFETTMGVRNIFYEAVWATLGPTPEYRFESDP